MTEVADLAYRRNGLHRFSRAAEISLIITASSTILLSRARRCRTSYKISVYRSMPDLFHADSDFMMISLRKFAASV